MASQIGMIAQCTSVCALVNVAHPDLGEDLLVYACERNFVEGIYTLA